MNLSSSFLSSKSVFHLAAAMVGAAIVPMAAAGDMRPSGGEHLAGPLAEETGSIDTSVLPAAWDQSSYLLERGEDRATDGDRPGVMRRLVDLARGRVLIEGGYAYVSDRSGGVDYSEHIVPDLLLRLGLTERLEIRLGWPGVSIVEQQWAEGRASDSRALDPNVGFMLDLWQQQGWLPQTAALASVPITLTGNRFAANSIQPLSGLLYQWYLTDRLAAGGESSVAFFRDQGDHFLQWQQSADMDYLLTDRVGVFSQWQVLADDGSRFDATRHMLSGGASWLCTDRLQLTCRAGVGLNEAAPDFLTDIRFAFLF